MIVVVVFAYLILAFYQYLLLKSRGAGLWTKGIVYAVTVAVLLVIILGYYVPSAVNPNRWITMVFGPVQDRIQMKR